MRLLAALTFALLGPQTLCADCRGRDLIASLPPAELTALQAKANVPYAHGNFWTAAKDGQLLTIVGAFPADQRFRPVMERLSPILDRSKTLVVQMSPVWLKVLQDQVKQDPTFIFSMSRPTLREQLGEADWQALVHGMTVRGFPAAVVGMLKPWLANWWLKVPPCVMPPRGRPSAVPDLEKFLTDNAKSQGIPIRSLDNFDQIMARFTSPSPAQQITALKQAIADQSHLDDIYATAANRYFAGESRVYLEYERTYLSAVVGIKQAEFDTFLARYSADLDTSFTRWVPILEETAAKGPTLVAISAYDLSGKSGLLSRLADRGWTIAPLAP